MMFKETFVRGDVSSQHVIQLFDTVETRAEAVADFVRAGYDRGASLLAVLSQEHWASVADVLRASEFPLTAAVEGGRVTVRDAAAVLEEFVRRGRPDALLFDAAIGSLVRTLAGNGRPLWIYGEIVDLLAAEGDFRGAHILEELWNGLTEQHSFTLFCGYAAVNFGDPRSTESLRSICRSHSLVRSNPRDLLGSYLLTGAAVHSSPAE